MCPLLLAAALATPGSAFGDGSCGSWLAPNDLSTIEKSGLDEVSGMASSRAWPGVLWLHNDSGGASQVYAVDLLGQSRGSWSVLGSLNEDWEDIGLGPCPAAEIACSCLYIGDIGDNELERDGYVIYRVPEPDLDAGDGGQTALAEAIHFRYPDGPRDAEALTVHPETGEVWVFTKADGVTEIFSFPDAPPEPRGADAPYTLEPVAELPLTGLQSPSITGADLSPRGDRLVLRSDEDLIVYSAPSGGTLEEALALGAIPLPSLEADGEAASWSPEGDRIYLVNEEASPTLWDVTCADYVGDGLGDDDPLVCGDETTGCAGCADAGASSGSLAALAALGTLGLIRRRAARYSAAVSINSA